MTTAIERSADQPATAAEAAEPPPRRPSIGALLTRPLAPAGALFAFALDALRVLFRGPFRWGELLDQAWFVTKVSLLPACMIMIPFGATFSLQIGSLF